MEPDYKNWMPRGMIAGLGGGAAVCALGALCVRGASRVGSGVLWAAALLLAAAALWCVTLYRAFSYRGKRQMARQIIEGTAQYIMLPRGGCGLDVGCGSGALAIACAKRNPQAGMVGIDRWGKEYASFSQPLCERNARAEGVPNVRFARGDAIKLDFADESFDAVCSNYVYHNIPSRDRQALLRETLRVLKKGGVFAIHDLFSAGRYGDMAAFMRALRAEGYEDVQLIDTTDGRFMSKTEAALLGLSGSALLVGRK